MARLRRNMPGLMLKGGTLWVHRTEENNTKHNRVMRLVSATTILDYLGSSLLRVIALTNPLQRSLMVVSGG